MIDFMQQHKFHFHSFKIIFMNSIAIFVFNFPILKQSLNSQQLPSQETIYSEEFDGIEPGSREQVYCSLVCQQK